MEWKRRLGALLFPLVLAGCFARPAPAPVEPQEHRGLGELPEGVRKQVEALADPEAPVEIDMMALTPDDLKVLERTVARLGGRTVEARPEERHMRAEVPAGSLEQLAREAPVSSLGTNRVVSVEPAEGALVAADGPGRDIPLPDVLHNQSAIRLPQLRQLQEASGESITIAVIDTGVDPVHPSLQRTPSGAPKLIDWKDFTLEGAVKTEVPVTTQTFIATGREWNVGSVRSAGGRLWFGTWAEIHVYGVINRDLDRNGSNVDFWGVLVADSTVPGVYDTVYVDLNRNRNFGDDPPIRVFRQTGQTFKLGTAGTRDRRAGFVLADIAKDGRSVTFGFDGHGHGTQVAGVAAASDFGIAPGAQVMALKALRADGSGDWFRIQNAIVYAAQNGADIINVSVQDLIQSARSDSTASEWLNEIARRYGVLIVVAAGNSGPGLSSGGTLGDASEIMTVGAYYSPDIWERDFGYRLPTEGIWSRTGMGPRSDGTVVPSMVAPGSVGAPTPQWLSPTGYRIAEGTSVATPHVSGVAALLIDGARRSGKNSDYKSVKRALEMGARSIPGYQIIEQGHGLIQGDAAWEHLRRVDSQSQVRAHGEHGGSGLLARSFVPGSAEFRIENLGSKDLRVGLVSLADWVQVRRQSLLVPGGGSRALPVEYRPPSNYGLHSAFIVLREFGHYGPDIWIPTTYVSPIPLDKERNYQHRSQGTLQAARYQRYFYELKAGTAMLNVRTLVPGTPEPAGRVQFFVFRPDGQEAYRSPVLGAGGDGISSLAQIPLPLEGTWEVVVSSLPDVIQHRPDQPVSSYLLEVDATQVAVSPWPLKFVMAPGETTTVPLRFTNQSSPFTGKVTAMGLIRADQNQTADWEIKRKFSPADSFELKLFTGLLKLEVARTDLKVELWRDGQAIAQGYGGIEARNLPVGRYSVVIEPETELADPRYQYRRLVGVDNAHLLAEDHQAQRNRGDSWTVPLTVRAPLQPGRYVGQVLLTEAPTGRVVHWYPIEVQVGLPKLTVSAMESALSVGTTRSVTLEVREQETGKPANVPITVAGRRYVVRNGTVTVPVVPSGERLNLPVTIDTPAYAYLDTSVTLYVPPSWKGLPVGLEPQNITTEQRKVMEQVE